MYRLYIVYNRNPWIAVLPLALLVGTGSKLMSPCLWENIVFTAPIQSRAMASPSTSREEDLPRQYFQAVSFLG